VRVASGGARVREVGHGDVGECWLKFSVFESVGANSLLLRAVITADLLFRLCGQLVGVETVPLGLWEEEDDHEGGDCDHGGVKPPEVAPADGLGHGSGDDWTDHEGAHVPNPVKGVPETTVVKEENVGDNGWLDGFGRACTNTVETVQGQLELNFY